MTKKEIKTVLKERGFTVIIKSWYYDESKTCVLFNAYGSYGECFKFWIDTNRQYADYTLLSDVCLHEAREISDWFWK